MSKMRRFFSAMGKAVSHKNNVPMPEPPTVKSVTSHEDIFIAPESPAAESSPEKNDKWSGSSGSVTSHEDISITPGSSTAESSQENYTTLQSRLEEDPV